MVEVEQNHSPVGFIPSMDSITAEVKREIAQEKSPEELVNKEGIYVYEDDEAIYIPKKYRNHITHYYHFGTQGGHQGANKTLARIRQHFRWPKMKDDIQEIKDTCFPCLRRNTHLKPNVPGHLGTTELFEVVACDLFGPFSYHEHVCMFDHPLYIT